MSLPPVLQYSRVPFPIWALRPGTFETLQPAAAGMSMWLLIASINGEESAPCRCSETTLSEALGFRDRKACRSRLKKLREVPGLLFEVPLGHSSGARLRPYARWATDPARRQADWFPRIKLYWIPKLAEEFGFGPEWINEQIQRLEQHARAAAQLLDAFKDELMVPCAEDVQNAVWEGAKARLQQSTVALKKTRKKKKEISGPAQRPRKRKRRKSRR